MPFDGKAMTTLEPDKDAVTDVEAFLTAGARAKRRYELGAG